VVVFFLLKPHYLIVTWRGKWKIVAMRVTLRDVAKQAELHFTTVSLALRNSPKLKPATRLRIQRLAKKMGYVPDPMLAALNAYRQAKQPANYQATIAWIHQWVDSKDLYGCEEFRQYYLGACERGKEQGYLVEEFWLSAPDMNVDKLHRILRARNITGALLAPLPEPGFLNLRYEELSAVAFGYSLQPAVLDLITNYQIHTMNLLLRKVLELGYRRIGFCLPRGWNAKVDNSYLGSILSFHEKRQDLPHIPVFWDITWDSGLTKELSGWIKKYRPEVIVSFDELLKPLLAGGFHIPKDLGFASLFLRQRETYLSGVHQNDRLIGRKAVDLVIGKLLRGETGIPETPVRVLVEGVWYPGKTLKKSGSVKSPSHKAPA
jgi:LacI family transcriptional regulator